MHSRGSPRQSGPAEDTTGSGRKRFSFLYEVWSGEGYWAEAHGRPAALEGLGRVGIGEGA